MKTVRTDETGDTAGVRRAQQATADALTGKQSKVLAAITALRKLCNHPKLVYDMLYGQGSEKNQDSFGSCKCAPLRDPLEGSKRASGAPS
eukprot:5099871-Pyramimonas_sp.AAC.1